MLRKISFIERCLLKCPVTFYFNTKLRTPLHSRFVFDITPKQKMQSYKSECAFGGKEENKGTHPPAKNINLGHLCQMFVHFSFANLLFEYRCGIKSLQFPVRQA